MQSTWTSGRPALHNSIGGVGAHTIADKDVFNGDIGAIERIEHGVAHGNDWARGFMRAMRMRHDGWAELVEDEEHGGWLIPMMILYHEHDEGPKMRPEPITPKKREDIIVHMAAGLVGAYRYFRAHRKAYAGSAFVPESRRTTSKVGRNDPCPCGSGKKYKKFCGGATVN
jgi:uncharacterized protein